MKPATVAPRPIPKSPATRRSAIEEARCSAETRVRLRTWFAVVATPNPDPPQGAGRRGAHRGDVETLVRVGRHSDPGPADSCADEGLPGTVDEGEARVAECARQ